MDIPYLNSTYCAHGLFQSHLQTCASNRVGKVRQSTQHHDQSQYRLEDYPTVIDSAVFPARSTTSAPCKVHSIPIHPPR
jgi:hypothetical protein